MNIDVGHAGADDRIDGHVGKVAEALFLCEVDVRELRRKGGSRLNESE